MRRFSLIIAPLLLAACGQTGPLYMPDHPPPLHGISLQQSSLSAEAVTSRDGSKTTAAVNVSDPKSNELRDRLQTPVLDTVNIPAQPVPAGGTGSPLAPTP